MAITLNTKAYSFSGLVNRIATYFHRPAGPASGWSELTATCTPGDTKTQLKSRARWKLAVPVVASETTAAYVAGDVLRVADADIIVRSEAVATSAELADLYLRIKDLVASPEFKASIETLTTPAA